MTRLLALFLLVCGWSAAQGQTPVDTLRHASESEARSPFRLIWRQDASVPLCRLAWLTPSDSISSAEALLLVEYARMHRSPDRFPLLERYRVERPRRVVWENVGHVSDFPKQVDELFHDVCLLPYEVRRLGFTMMRLEKRFDQTRSAADWFIDQELLPVLWGVEASDFQQRQDYRSLRKVDVGGLRAARGRLLADSSYAFVGTGPLPADSVRLLLAQAWARNASAFQLAVPQRQATEPYHPSGVMPCDTQWVTLQEDALAPVVTHAWLWHADSVSEAQIDALRSLARWLDSPLSSLWRDWVANTRLYQVQTRLWVGRQRVAFCVYSFPRIDLVQHVMMGLPEALAQSTAEDWQRMFVFSQQSERLDADYYDLESPERWMQAQIEYSAASSEDSSKAKADDGEILEMLKAKPCITAALINSRHAREAGLEPDEDGLFAEVGQNTDTLAAADSSHVDTLASSPERMIPHDALADIVLYFDSRYPEIRDERLLYLEQAIEALERYPEARLAIYGAVVNRMDVNAELIGRMWAEYIRDFLVQQRGVPEDRIVTRSAERVHDARLGTRFDRKISFQLISDL